MEEKVAIVWRPNLFSQEQRLVFAASELEYIKGGKKATFLKKDIDGFRYGVRFIQGYQFVFGRVYCIDVRSNEGEIISIRLMSLYRVGVKKLSEKYSKLLNAVYGYYFHEMVAGYVDKFKNNQPFSFLDVQVIQAGLIIPKQAFPILWSDVELRTYYRYYTISSKINGDVYIAFEYIHYWNAIVLYNTCKLILKNKGYMK